MKAKTILIIIAILALIGLTNSLYTVAENEYACTVRFSKIIDTTDEAGLHFKVPFIDSVKYFTKATQLYDIPPSEVLTSDKQNMTVDCYILWSISDPKLFYQTLGSTGVAEDRLDNLTYNELKTVMGAFLAASLALDAESAFSMIIFAAAGFSFRKSKNFSPIKDSTIPLTSLLPSLVLVCPSNCASVTLTEIIAVRPSLTSSPVRSGLSLSRFIFFA